MTIYGSVLKYTLIASAALLVIVSAYASSVFVSLYYRSEADLRAGVDLSERSTVTRLRELRGGAKGTPAELLSLFGWRAPRQLDAKQLKRSKGTAGITWVLTRKYLTKEPKLWLPTDSPPQSPDGEPSADFFKPRKPRLGALPPIPVESPDQVPNADLVGQRKPRLGSLPSIPDTSNGASDGDIIPGGAIVPDVLPKPSRAV